jgi:hypothetical protein
MRPIVVLILAVVLSGCAAHDHQLALTFAQRQPLRLCLWLDTGISDTEARGLVAGVSIPTVVVRSDPWIRPAFTWEGILDHLATQLLPPDCEKAVAFVNPHLGDALWGLFLPQVLGGANTRTGRAFVVARRVSFDSLLRSPTSVLEHELLHLLGCHHHDGPMECHETWVAKPITP